MADLPELPIHPEPRTYTWTKLELEAIAQWGQEVRRQALEDAAREVDGAIGEAIAGHFNKQAISALMQTRDMLRERALKDKP